jgi:hypothetical protein
MMTADRNGRGLTPHLPTPESIAAARVAPHFKQALAALAVSSVEYYQRRWLASRLLNDRGRFGMATLIMLLHFDHRPGTPDSGLTASRLRDVCIEVGLCGAGRVESLLLTMQASGFLKRAEGSNPRERRFEPTPRAIELHRERHRRVLTALDILRDDKNYAAKICDGWEEAVYRHYVTAIGGAFIAGYRLVNAAPELRPLIDRDAGLPLLMCILLASPDYAGFAPAEFRPTSVAGLADRFKVTRMHVRSMLRDAEAARLLIRHGDTEAVTALPPLLSALENFFASALLMSESSADLALAMETGSVLDI